jgi:WD40 repeat protein
LDEAHETTWSVGSLKVYDNLLACGHADGIVQIWDWHSGQLIHVLDNEIKEYISTINIDGSLLATGQSKR